VQARCLTLELWRDYDEEASLVPGMYLGRTQVFADPASTAAELFEAGVRRVALCQIVDVTGCSDARQVAYALAAVAEFTGAGLVVDWRLRLGETDGSLAWRLLSHLYPPSGLISAEDEGAVLREWTSTFAMGKLAYRRGPGFVQVRDSRWGGIRQLTIDDPRHLEAIERLRCCSQADDIPLDVLDRFRGRHLIGGVEDVIWWLPYRRRRWSDAV
jgi:Family of unknown function (DUF5825)